MGPSGRKSKQIVVETSTRNIREALRSISGEKHICLEEGEYSEWLYEICEPLSKEIVVVWPEKVRGAKSDTLDAWKRADELRRGEINRVVYKKPKQYRSLREAVRFHQVIVSDLVRAKNRLRSIFRSRGMSFKGEGIYSSQVRSTWNQKLPSGVSQRACLLGEELDRLTEIHEQAETWLLEEASKTPAVKLVSTVPGIGPIRAAQIVAVVITPYRFRTSRQFWSYCGLGVVTRSSSDWVKDRKQGWVRKEIPQTRGLNNNRNPLLKCVFKGASLTVVRMLDTPLKQHYLNLIEHTKPNLARLTIARRIAATVLAVWKNKEVYDPAKQNRARLR